MAEVPVVDGYSELVAVARGGFGVVYRARQDRHGRVVALKVLSLVDLDERGRQRFERECVAMGSLSWHPNVVALHDSGMTADGHPFLAMEYLEAGSLADRLRAGPTPWPEAVVAGVQVAGALDAAHRAGTLHRDLKPENLLVGPYGEVKLGDFGIAAVEGGTRTTVGHASFTVAHVAPELLKGQRPDERSDLYGLASTLYTLVSGAPPFAGEADEPFATVMARVLQDPAPRLRDVPDDLADLLLQALAKDPGERPESAAAFGQALQRVQADNAQPVTELRLALTAAVAPTDPARADPTSADTTPTDTDAAEAPEPVAPPPAPMAPPPATPRGDSSPTIHLTPASARDEPPSPADSPGLPETAPDTAGPPRRRRRGVVIAAAAAVLLAPGGTFLIVTRNDLPSATATVDVGARPAGVAVTDDAVWVTNAGEETVSRIDPATNEVIATIDVDSPEGVAATNDAVWVAQDIEGTVARIDPATNRVTDTIDVGQSPIGVAATDDAVWVTDSADHTVSRVDPATNEVVDTIEAGNDPAGVAATDDAVWVTDFGGDAVIRIDPATNLVTATKRAQSSLIVQAQTNAVSATDDAVWIGSFLSTVTRVDPATNQIVATVEVTKTPNSIAVTGTAVWVAIENGTVARIDPATNQIVDRIDVDDRPVAVAATDTSAWVANSDSNTVSRIDLG